MMTIGDQEGWIILTRAFATSMYKMEKQMNDRIQSGEANECKDTKCRNK